MLTRLPDWRERLAAFVAATDQQPFAWSTQDCAAWPLRALDAMCGTDHAAALAGAKALISGGQPGGLDAEAQVQRYGEVFAAAKGQLGCPS